MTTSVDVQRAFKVYVEAVLNAREGKTTILGSPNGDVVIMGLEKYNELTGNINSTIHSGHFINQCKICDKVINQCRCAGEKEIFKITCNNCRKKEKHKSNFVFIDQI